MDKKPFELRILGPTELVSAASGPVDNLVRQPKRLALLAYLALCTADGFRRRDEIIGLFWPELDQAQGRTYLRKSLHALREELGTEVLTTRGDDEVRVKPEALYCDAVEMEKLINAGQYSAALNLYRGELLGGLYPEGVAQEFEEWLRSERQSMRRQAARAARELAMEREASGDTAGAATAIRRALEIEPDSEERVRDLIRLLDKRGDRAGALRVYKDWQKRLQDEYGVEPAPQTRKLARAVQAARKGESHETPPAARALPRLSFVSAELKPLPRNVRTSRRKMLGYGIVLLAIGSTAATLALGGPDYPAISANAVTVLPLRRIGDAASNRLADGICEEISTRLAMETGITVRAVSTDPANAKRDPRDLAREVGAAYFIDGALQQSGERTRITLRLVRTNDASVIWATAEDISAGDGARVQATAAQIARTISDQVGRKAR